MTQAQSTLQPLTQHQSSESPNPVATQGRNIARGIAKGTAKGSAKGIARGTLEDGFMQTWSQRLFDLEKYDEKGNLKAG